MKRLLGTVVLIAVVFFVGGGVAVIIGWLNLTVYAVGAGIGGSVASVIGLLSLARPSITRTDIEAIGVESLAKLSSLAEEVRSAQEERSQTREEIAQLAAQKEAMQVLVRKASLSLFLSDRVAKTNERIGEILAENKELRSLLDEYGKNVEKLQTLNEEISTDENVQTLMEVLAEARSRQTSGPDTLGELLGEFAGSFLGRVLRF